MFKKASLSCGTVQRGCCTMLKDLYAATIETNAVIGQVGYHKRVAQCSTSTQSCFIPAFTGVLATWWQL